MYIGILDACDTDRMPCYAECDIAFRFPTASLILQKKFVSETVSKKNKVLILLMLAVGIELTTRVSYSVTLILSLPYRYRRKFCRYFADLYKTVDRKFILFT